MTDSPNSYVSPQGAFTLKVNRNSELESKTEGGAGSESEPGLASELGSESELGLAAELGSEFGSGSDPGPGSALGSGAESEKAQAQSEPAPTIEQLLERHRNLWRGFGAGPDGGREGIATGFAPLDDALPESGWPAQGIIEVVSGRPGIGELQLFLPLMRSLIARGRWIVWVAPPYSPYAPSLVQAGIDLRRVLVVGQQPYRSASAETEKKLVITNKEFNGKNPDDSPVFSTEGKRQGSHAGGMSSKDALWCLEKALQTRYCGVVLAWHSQLPQRALRRLQLAATTGKALGVVFMKNNSEHSPSSMRLDIKSFAAEKPSMIEVAIRKARGSFRPSTVRLDLDRA